MVNALTLSGARMVIMRGLIERVGNADQLAGVMAHETGHIARRDPMVALFRGAGIGVISATLGIILVLPMCGRWLGDSWDCRIAARWSASPMRTAWPICKQAVCAAADSRVFLR
ncbi:hypothetical protein Bphyt_6587 [Paraburkholderia phytofirmans PsJN]|uniref:Peptidase M48 domain-containing protein n=1 Tax=Paraburkholderia phytofirmans (strain DSM 17436 / LMG 22146 / PsJN) TaxID=398527 RepID=B2TBE8_PARPJ|nr:hypothetical protein Bphyt_6587 [Paraburkholderia phytofirmans PsJN]